jgi:hypothetical protein
MQFVPPSPNYFLLRNKHYPQHPVLKHPHFVSLLMSETNFYNRTQPQVKLYSNFIFFGSRQNKKKSVGFSPQANYTDWATATCRRNLVPTFADRGVSRGERGGSPTVVKSQFSRPDFDSRQEDGSFWTKWHLYV